MAGMPLARSGVLLSALVLAVSGCNCRTTGIGTKEGEVGVVWRDPAGNRIVNRDAVYDFGTALVGETRPLAMTVRNVGAGTLTLVKLERTGGDTVSIGADVVDNAPFAVAFENRSLTSSEQTEYQMTFSPKELKGDFEVKLALTAEGTRAEDAVATITLKGQGEKGACDLPAEIDFGKVPVGETLPYELPLVNPTSVNTQGFAGDITGQDAAAFAYAAQSPKGDVAVPAKTTVHVIYTFSPTEKRQYTATVKLRGPGQCPEQDTVIKGEGSDDVLTWSPTSINYGFVSPGFDAFREVTFVNQSSVPIRLTNVVLSNINDYFRESQSGVAPDEFIVPGGGVPVPMRIACSPAALGPRPGATLTFATPLTRNASGTVNLSCVGGGPKIKVTPRPNLSFGRVGFFPGNANFKVTRKINVQNIGTRPPMPDPNSNLYLGQVAMDGTPGQLPLFDLVPKNAATDLDEITVALGSPYNPSNGIEAVAGSNWVDLLVTLTPKSTGMKEAELILYSNDSTEPEVRVTITADVQQLPPCNYRVSPAQADFGLVTPPLSKDLPINITNLGSAATDICYLSGIDLAAGSDLAYSIVGGPVVEKELQPQETWQVVVRVQPTGNVPTTLQTLVGSLLFNVTSPTTPQVSVPLRTSVGPACLAITPDPLDFGTVRRGCNSAPRTFNIYNVCSTPIALQGFAMQAAGGQAPGGPNCPGTSPCPEFFLTQTPAIPSGGLIVNPGGAPVTFQAKYAPIDIGSDQGAVSITAIQSGQTIAYLVGLQGTGDAIGQQTDTFIQDQQPKADILLVVDDSCSMGDKQTAMAANFQSFIQYAQAANVDYQIGVITTTASNQDCLPPPYGCIAVNSKYLGEGILVRDGANSTSSPPLILTPTTPNLAQKFSNAVNVGTAGSGTEEGLETAVMALTPPKIGVENAGFLRTDANLAIVVVSDAGDQSPQAVSYYQNRLLNVKGFNRLSMFTFNTIGPQASSAPGSCTYDGGGDVVRYNTITSYTGGVQDEICTNNWAATLQGLGRTAFGFRTQFFLNNTPDTSGGRVIDVKIDGQSAPAGSWSYDAAANSIRFTPTTTPGPGQNLEVTYFTACF